MSRFGHRAVPIALAAVLIDTIGFGVVMPVFPELITQLGHIDLKQATRVAGYMLVVFSVAQFFAGSVLGNLSDRFGRRAVLITSMLAFGVDYALMSIAPTLAWLFVGRTVAGAAGAVYGPASSVLADVTEPDKRSTVFGYMSAAFGIGFVIGPALGGVLSYLGPRAPFVAAAVLALVNATVMYLAMPETLAPENRRPFRWRDAHIIGAFRPLFGAGDAAPLLLAWFLWQLASMIYPATWAFWAAIRFGWDSVAIGWSLAFVGLVMALVQMLVTGRAMKRFGERRAMVIGLASGSAAFFTYAFVTASWQAYTVFLVSALSALVFPAFNGLLSRMVGAKHQGALQGGMGSMGSVAAIVSPLLFTQALAVGVSRGLPGAAFLLASLFGFAALALIVWKVLRQVPGQLSGAPGDPISASPTAEEPA